MVLPPAQRTHRRGELSDPAMVAITTPVTVSKTVRRAA
jgi:hypothetical protein